MRAATGAVRRAVCGNMRATRATWNIVCVVGALGNLTWGFGREQLSAQLEL